MLYAENKGKSKDEKWDERRRIRVKEGHWRSERRVMEG
jgi:hypothetical protein